MICIVIWRLCVLIHIRRRIAWTWTTLNCRTLITFQTPSYSYSYSWFRALFFKLFPTNISATLIKSLEVAGFAEQQSRITRLIFCKVLQGNLAVTGRQSAHLAHALWSAMLCWSVSSKLSWRSYGQTTELLQIVRPTGTLYCMYHTGHRSYSIIPVQ